MTELNALFGVLLGGASGLVALLVRGGHDWVQRRAADTFSDYAASRGLHFEPGAVRGASPSVAGAGDRTDIYRLGGMLRTRTVAVARCPPGLVFHVVQRGHGGGGRRGTPLDLGDAPTALLRIDGGPADLERLVVAGEALARLAAERTQVQVVGNGTTIALSWNGIEEEYPVLDTAREVVLALAGERGFAAPYR